MDDRQFIFESNAKHDHISIFVNNSKIEVSFDERRYNHKGIPVADSGSVFNYVIQEKTAEAIRTYAEALKSAAQNKPEVNVSAVLVADALLKILDGGEE